MNIPHLKPEICIPTKPKPGNFGTISPFYLYQPSSTGNSIDLTSKLNIRAEFYILANSRGRESKVYIKNIPVECNTCQYNDLPSSASDWNPYTSTFVDQENCIYIIEGDNNTIN